MKRTGKTTQASDSHRTGKLEKRSSKKSRKKCLTNETECGKIVKRSREERNGKRAEKLESRENPRKIESERTLKIKQRDERRTRDF